MKARWFPVRWRYRAMTSRKFERYTIEKDYKLPKNFMPIMYRIQKFYKTDGQIRRKIYNKPSRRLLFRQMRLIYRFKMTDKYRNLCIYEGEEEEEEDDTDEIDEDEDDESGDEDEGDTEQEQVSSEEDQEIGHVNMACSPLSSETDVESNCKSDDIQDKAEAAPTFEVPLLRKRKSAVVERMNQPEITWSVCVSIIRAMLKKVPEGKRRLSSIISRRQKGKIQHMVDIAKQQTTKRCAELLQRRKKIASNALAHFDVNSEENQHLRQCMDKVEDILYRGVCENKELQRSLEWHFWKKTPQLTAFRQSSYLVDGLLRWICNQPQIILMIGNTICVCPKGFMSHFDPVAKKTCQELCLFSVHILGLL